MVIKGLGWLYCLEPFTLRLLQNHSRAHHRLDAKVFPGGKRRRTTGRGADRKRWPTHFVFDDDSFIHRSRNSKNKQRDNVEETLIKINKESIQGVTEFQLRGNHWVVEAIVDIKPWSAGIPSVTKEFDNQNPAKM
jgi:hypothetical protein